MIELAMTMPEWAGIIGGGIAAVAAAVGAYVELGKRRVEREREVREAEDGTVIIRQAQGANTILDATVRALNSQVERYAAEVDRERALRERAEERASDLRRQLTDCRQGRDAQ